MVVGQLDSHMLKNEVVPLTHTIYKINSKMINNLNIRANTITLEEKIEVNLHGCGFGNGLLDDSKAWTIKEKKINWIPSKLKTCSSKNTIKKEKRQPTEFEKIFVNHISDRDTLLRVI